jgi:two-component system response regulator YesN
MHSFFESNVIQFSGECRDTGAENSDRFDYGEVQFHRRRDMRRKSILLVEDDGVLRDLLRCVLEREYHIMEAATASESKNLAVSHIDLALIDYSLPDGNGFDVLKALREAKPGLPVILMTAYSTENLAVKAFRMGVTDYLKKPLSFAYLRGKLSELLDGKMNGESSQNAEHGEVFVMECIVAFIEENYMKKINRDKLAEKACMDRYKFSRRFKERFGRNIKSYLNNVRTQRAAELLGNQDLSISEVAFSVGYGSVPHFYRVFREQYGISPREYRESLSISSPGPESGDTSSRA